MNTDMNKRNYETIGFVGLGVMGLPMAANLLKAGYRLAVSDLNRERINQLPSQDKVTAVDHLKDIAAKSEVVVLMLPNSPHVEEVIAGPDGLMHALKPGSLVIDMSSISPTVTRRLGGLLAAQQIEFLDAPVSGGETGAIQGSLTIMVGGSGPVFEEARPLLGAMGKRIIHCGEAGSGQVVKVVNQLMSAVNLLGLSEGLTLGTKLGVRPEIIREVILGGAGRSWALEDRAPVIMDGNFEPGFTIDLHTKDITLALEAGKDQQVPLYATSLAHEIFKTLQLQGKGRKDNSAVITLYEELAGIKVRKQ